MTHCLQTVNSCNSLFQALFHNSLSIVCPLSVTFPCGCLQQSILCLQKEKNKQQTHQQTLRYFFSYQRAWLRPHSAHQSGLLSEQSPESSPSCRSWHAKGLHMILYNLHEGLFIHPDSHCIQNYFPWPTQSCIIRIFFSTVLQDTLEIIVLTFLFFFS